MFLLASQALAEPIVGAGVGNADTLVSEGVKLFNRKQYAKAADLFLKATRAEPATPGTYVQLARASMLGKQYQRACYAYRVYLKSIPDSPDRKKAAAEGEQCERQLKIAKRQPPDLTQRYVEVRAQFFSALDQKQVLGDSGAADSLRELAKDGFLGPDLKDMAQKLGAVANAEADAIHQRALGGEVLPASLLRSARPLYLVAQDVGASAADTKGRMAFLDGLAELGEGDLRKAEVLFSEAAKSDAANLEYVFYRSLALFQAGDKAAALKVMESSLKNDPRTAVLRLSMALGQSSEAGANELEKLLFTARFP